MTFSILDPAISTTRAPSRSELRILSGQATTRIKHLHSMYDQGIVPPTPNFLVAKLFPCRPGKDSITSSGRLLALTQMERPERASTPDLVSLEPGFFLPLILESSSRYTK